MKIFKYILFYLMASILAPFHFKPRKCYVINKDRCPIWNCLYYSCPSDCICNR